MSSYQEKEKAREEKLKEQAEKLLLKEQKRNAEIEYVLCF